MHGGPDGLLPQHLKDLTGPTAGDGGVSLLSSLVGLLTLILEGRTPQAIRPIIFGANLIALTKKDGGIRPIAIGCTLRRLASKCACIHAMESIPQFLSPYQLGFGVPGGADAAVHASRIFLNSLPSDKALLKVDFSNAFNTIRRDKILEATKAHIPTLLPFVHSVYSSSSTLLWEGELLLSSEGIQQGDPLGPMLFCIAIHSLVSILESEFKAFFLDDGTLGGTFGSLTADLKRIEEIGQSLGLSLNMSKSELICHNRSAADAMVSNFPGLRFTVPQEATLLGSPLGPLSMEVCLEAQLQQLKLVGERLCHLEAHDAITILRHSFAIPKLQHVLRTSPTFSSPLLISWDNLLLSIVSRITNIDFRSGDSPWQQATLPVGSGGLGFRSALHLAPSAFLASADGASALVQQLLPAHLSSIAYSERDSALAMWRVGLPEDTSLPTGSSRHKQKSWDKPRVEQLYHSILSNCEDEISSARVLAAASSHSGAWLNAPPVSSLGLRMCNDTIRVAVGLRVGAMICQPHICELCGKDADSFGHHRLSCRSSQGRSARHHALNTIISRSLAAASVPSRLEPTGLHRADGNRPDGITMTPWSEGRFLVWDATCVDTFCQSHRRRCATEAGAASAYAEEEKKKKYAHLSHSYFFQPVAVETSGSVGVESMAFLKDLGHRVKMATGEPQSFSFLMQRLAVAVQVGNTISVLGTLGSCDAEV